MSPADFKVLRDTVIELAVTVVELKEKMPSRIGGYSIDLSEFMKQIGRERMTEELKATIMAFLTDLLGDSVDELSYISDGRYVHLTFNDKLRVVDNFICFGSAPAHAIRRVRK